MTASDCVSYESSIDKLGLSRHQQQAIQSEVGWASHSGTHECPVPARMLTQFKSLRCSSAPNKMLQKLKDHTQILHLAFCGGGATIH